MSRFCKVKPGSQCDPDMMPVQCHKCQSDVGMELIYTPAL